jgi:hypothetical protein
MAKAARTADQRLAMAALEKQRRGASPTREEAAALRRTEKEIENQRRLEYYRAVPKKNWREWSGRQDKVIREQAARYGFPMLGVATIDLEKFAKRFHDFLADNAKRLAASDDDDPTLAGVASPALERKRQIECLRLELLLQRDQGMWIDRTVIHGGFGRIGGILRAAGEALLRQFGPAAQKIINDALDNCEREVDRLLAADADSDGNNAECEERGSS